jgi:hypothetical protein
VNLLTGAAEGGDKEDTLVAIMSASLQHRHVGGVSKQDDLSSSLLLQTF